jgi:hypothetical protein
MRHERFVQAARHAELQRGARRMGRHCAFALVGAAAFALAATALIGARRAARAKPSCDCRRCHLIRINDRCRFGG